MLDICFSIFSLHKFTEYSVTVVCYTSQGDGPRTPAVVMRTQEDGECMSKQGLFFCINQLKSNITQYPRE